MTDERVQTEIDKTPERQPPIFWDGLYPFWVASCEDVCPVCNRPLQLRVNKVNGREVVDAERCDFGHNVHNDEIPF